MSLLYRISKYTSIILFNLICKPIQTTKIQSQNLLSYRTIKNQKISLKYSWRLPDLIQPSKKISRIKSKSPRKYLQKIIGKERSQKEHNTSISAFNTMSLKKSVNQVKMIKRPNLKYLFRQKISIR